MKRRTVGFSTLERLEAIVANDALYRLADLVPIQHPSTGGRPRLYPAYMWLLFDALLSVYGSGRRVEAELAHPVVWDRLQSLIREKFPAEPDRWLPARPIRRHHYLYGRTQYLTSPEILEQIAELHRELATEQAQQWGLLDSDGPGSWTHPDLSRMLYADGKVVTPLFRAKPGDKVVDKTTGEVHYPRAEQDANFHVEGTGEMVWGTKFVIIAARHPQPHSRFILDVAVVEKSGGEAATALDHFVGLAPLVPGAQGVVYDTAFRGIHHQRLMRDLGWVSVNRVTANAGSRKRPAKDRKRVEKIVYVETKTIQTPDGVQQVRLISQGGRIGLGEVTESGKPLFVPLDRVRTHRNLDKRGTYRWYNDYRLPERLGGGTVTVRLNSNAEDTKRKFNRAENVRQIPPGDPDFEILYRRRNDAESINRHLDDTLWLRRAHSIGNRRQLLNMITYALGVNALSMHVHRHGLAPPQAA
ncbi:hypothetical protein N9Q18_01045 [bacterium]|nr:hypothetical protein [bacterium]